MLITRLFRSHLAGALVILALLVLPASGAAVAQEAPPRPPAAQDGFVPIDELPPGDELPAAPLLITAYAVAWLIVMGYAWSIWQRLGKVERDIAEVGRRVNHVSRS